MFSAYFVRAALSGSKETRYLARFFAAHAGALKSEAQLKNL
jgi:hypothetical protein